MNTIRFFIFCLTLILSTALATSIQAATVAPAEELAQLIKHYQTVQGKFTQRLVDSKEELLQESSGIFTVKSPGYFYWDTQEPFPQLLVSDLATIWLYDPDLEQVTLTPYSDSVDRSPALLLSGNVEQITQNYTVEKSTQAENTYILIPTFSPSNFSELQLTFDNNVLSTMQLKDSLEQTTSFYFTELVINQPVDNTLFSFEPPAGVDILKNE